MSEVPARCIHRVLWYSNVSSHLISQWCRANGLVWSGLASRLVGHACADTINDFSFQGHGTNHVEIDQITAYHVTWYIYVMRWYFTNVKLYIRILYMHVRIYVYIQFLFFFIVHTPRSLLGWLINLYSHSSKSATQALVCEQWMWTAHTLWSCLNSSSVHTHTCIYTTI